MIKYLLIAVLLAGCAHEERQKPLEDVVLVPKATQVTVPKETLRECDPLPRMEERPYTEADVLAFVQKVITPYADCKARKRDATLVITKALNSSK